MLDVKQLDYYDLNGYLSIEGVFSKTQIDALSDVTDQFVEKSRSVLKKMIYLVLNQIIHQRTQD